MAVPRYIPHYSVDDYRSWQGDWELWSGVPIAMSPSAKRVHQRVCGRLYNLFSSSLQSGGCSDCEVAFEVDWVVSDDTVYRPDLLITCHHPPSDYVTRTPLLVAEVLSDSTRQRDLVHKREAYQELGVKYYLLADPESNKLTVLVLGENGYEQVESPSLVLHDGCQFTADFSGLFG